MHRFYLPLPQCQGLALTLTGAEAHHALDVLRIKIGQPVVILDGAGREFLCAVRAVDRKAVTLAVGQTHFSPAPSCRVTLVQAVPKGKLLETIIQKATELGAFRIIPLLSERVATRLENEAVQHKAEKWRQAAVEAIKQCGQRWLPQVEAPVTLPALLARGEHFDLSLVGSLQSDARHPREYFRSQDIRPPSASGSAPKATSPTPNSLPSETPAAIPSTLVRWFCAAIPPPSTRCPSSATNCRLRHSRSNRVIKPSGQFRERIVRRVFVQLLRPLVGFQLHFRLPHEVGTSRLQSIRQP